MAALALPPLPIAEAIAVFEFIEKHGQTFSVVVLDLAKEHAGPKGPCRQVARDFAVATATVAVFDSELVLPEPWDTLSDAGIAFAALCTLDEERRWRRRAKAHRGEFADALTASVVKQRVALKDLDPLAPRLELAEHPWAVDVPGQSRRQREVASFMAEAANGAVRHALAKAGVTEEPDGVFVTPQQLLVALSEPDASAAARKSPAPSAKPPRRRGNRPERKPRVRRATPRPSRKG